MPRIYCVAVDRILCRRHMPNWLERTDNEFETVPGKKKSKTKKRTRQRERERQRYFGICNSSEVLVTLPLHSFYVSVYDLNRFMCVFCAFSCALLRSDSFSILFYSVHILEYRKMYNTLIYVYIVGGTVNSLAMTFVKWLHTQRSLLLFTHSMQCI